eukprot:8341264-Pyramimonas_sp.AAC.1
MDIDDSGLSAIGAPIFILARPPPAARALHAAFAGGVGAQVSSEKLALVCSNLSLGKGLAMGPRRYCGARGGRALGRERGRRRRFWRAASVPGQ